MKFRIFLFYLMILSIFFTGCFGANLNLIPKREVSLYSEEFFKVNKPLDLSLESNSGNIEIYSWEKDDIKFEITKKIRGLGEKKALEEKLKNLVVTLDQQDNKILYKLSYKGSIKNPVDRSVDLKVYIPKKINSIKCNMDMGNIKFFDDIKCELNADMKMANIDINRFEGKVNVIGDMCSVKIENGEITGDSSIKINFGNISIKSEFSENGGYKFNTGIGNVDLYLPATSKVSFESLGTLEINDFSITSYSTRVKVSTGMGKIAIRKY